MGKSSARPRRGVPLPCACGDRPPRQGLGKGRFPVACCTGIWRRLTGTFATVILIYNQYRTGCANSIAVTPFKSLQAFVFQLVIDIFMGFAWVWQSTRQMRRLRILWGLDRKKRKPYGKNPNRLPGALT